MIKAYSKIRNKLLFKYNTDEIIDILDDLNEYSDNTNDDYIQNNADSITRNIKQEYPPQKVLHSKQNLPILVIGIFAIVIFSIQFALFNDILNYYLFSFIILFIELLLLQVFFNSLVFKTSDYIRNIAVDNTSLKHLLLMKSVQHIFIVFFVFLAHNILKLFSFVQSDFGILIMDSIIILLIIYSLIGIYKNVKLLFISSYNYLYLTMFSATSLAVYLTIWNFNKVTLIEGKTLFDVLIIANVYAFTAFLLNACILKIFITKNRKRSINE